MTAEARHFDVGRRRQGDVLHCSAPPTQTSAQCKLTSSDSPRCRFIAIPRRRTLQLELAFRFRVYRQSFRRARRSAGRGVWIDGSHEACRRGSSSPCIWLRDKRIGLRRRREREEVRIVQMSERRDRPRPSPTSEARWRRLLIDVSPWSHPRRREAGADSRRQRRRGRADGRLRQG